ncbi:MAG: TIGR00375 family protein [Candidatus Nanohaloarchaea archaeon]|nr:TIGR00375 family protein [Candidatus Nanohaloarchaea archaeon]
MGVDADLHLHGLHSGGVSDRMELPVIAEQACRKGLDLVGTGDCLNPAWRSHIQAETEDQGNGILRAENGTDFLLTAEVEDTDRIHHLLLFPSIGAAEDVHDAFSSVSSDIDSEGRPRLSIGGERIAQICERHDVLVGPAHAFTPWTAIYKEFDSLQECYGNSADVVAFLELGLSADTALADSITAHHDLTFVSFSDAHSPWPHRLGREFTRFDMDEPSFRELEQALNRDRGRGTSLNVGFDPREGKYHCTACIDCYQKYTVEQAEEFDWRCAECSGTVKKGVKDRIDELADTGPGDSPGFRPDYVHLLPLAEIIQNVVGHASPTTKTVERIYDQFQDAFRSEIEILTEADIRDLEEVNPDVADAVATFRDDDVVIVPGGGGEYGEIIVPADEDERTRIEEAREDELACRYSNRQQRLDGF